MYDAGLRSAISAKFLQNQLLIVDRLELGSADKSLLRAKLDLLGLEGKKVYFMYGSDEPDYSLVTTCDMFTKKAPRNK